MALLYLTMGVARCRLIGGYWLWVALIGRDLQMLQSAAHDEIAEIKPDMAGDAVAVIAHLVAEIRTIIMQGSAEKSDIDRNGGELAQ